MNLHPLDRRSAVCGLIAVASVVVAGCGSTVSQNGVRGKQTPGVSVVGSGATTPAALRDWAAFPVNAVPRPLVLTGSSIIDPASGFANSDDKAAYLSGSFDLMSRLPSATATADGREVMTAQSALTMLKDLGAGNRLTSTHLQISRVNLGAATFDTDRGPQLLPAWIFRLRGVTDPTFVLALPQAQWWPKPGISAGQVVNQRAASSDGRRVTISFVGAAPGSGPCDAEYTADVAESPTAVMVTPRALPKPKPTGNYFCNEIGYRRTVTVALSAPLGNRVLLAPAGPPLPAR